MTVDQCQKKLVVPVFPKLLAEYLCMILEVCLELPELFVLTLNEGKLRVNMLKN